MISVYFITSARFLGYRCSAYKMKMMVFMPAQTSCLSVLRTKRLEFLINENRLIDNGFSLQLCVGKFCIQEHKTAAKRKSNVQFARQSVSRACSENCFVYQKRSRNQVRNLRNFLLRFPFLYIYFQLAVDFNSEMAPEYNKQLTSWRVVLHCISLKFTAHKKRGEGPRAPIRQINPGQGFSFNTISKRRSVSILSGRPLKNYQNTGIPHALISKLSTFKFTPGAILGTQGKV